MKLQCRLSTSTLAVLAVALFGVVSVGLAESGTGTFWEVKSQGSVEGPGGVVMKMPPMTLKSCIKTGDLPAPVDERRRCRRTNLITSPTTVTWKETCAGPPEATGEGTITYSEEGEFSGTIRFVMAEGNMTIQLAGKRVGPACTPR